MRTGLAFLIMLAMLASSSSSARAAVPNQFTVQGVLRDGAGALQSTPVDVSVSLFDASTSGTKLAGPFATTGVAVTDGLFTLPITDTNLPTELGTAAQIWIEVTIGTDVFPRQQLTSQLFALMCGTADAVKGLTITPAGVVGIGTSTPAGSLEVVGDAVVRAKNQADRHGRILFRSTPLGVVTNEYSMGTDYSSDNSHDFFLYDAANNAIRLLINNEGNLGVGTASSLNRLSVNGNADLGTNSRFAFAGPTEFGGITLPRGEIMFSNDNAQDQLYMLSNAYTQGAGTFSYRRTGVAAGIGIDNGFISLMTAPSGAADAAASMIGRVNVTNAGLVGIGTAAPSHLLHVNGDARNTTGVWATTSDQRLKRDIQTIEGALETVLGLRGVSFRWKDEAKDKKLGRVQGFIAQEVERVKPEWVKQGADGMKMIETIGMDALLVESIKAQQGQIKALRDENETLKARLARIEARLDGAPHDKRAAR